MCAVTEYVLHACEVRERHPIRADTKSEYGFGRHRPEHRRFLGGACRSGPGQTSGEMFPANAQFTLDPARLREDETTESRCP